MSLSLGLLCAPGPWPSWPPLRWAGLSISLSDPLGRRRTADLGNNTGCLLVSICSVLGVYHLLSCSLFIPTLCCRDTDIPIFPY